jgi:hypothetical protein
VPIENRRKSRKIVHTIAKSGELYYNKGGLLRKNAKCIKAAFQNNKKDGGEKIWH